MLKIALAKILNDLPFLILTINLSLYSCTKRVFRVTENKPIYLVLENVGINKNFFFLRGYNSTMPQISLISTNIFTKREKSA